EVEEGTAVKNTGATPCTVITRMKDGRTVTATVQPGETYVATPATTPEEPKPQDPKPQDPEPQDPEPQEPTPHDSGAEMPSPEEGGSGSGPGSPRSQQEMPNPEEGGSGSGPGSPRSQQEMPSPEEGGTGGGLGGPRSRDYRPAPDDPGPGNPHSDILRRGAFAVTAVVPASLLPTTGRETATGAGYVRVGAKIDQS